MLLHASDELYERIEDENSFRKMVSLYVMAPTMYSYVSWVLKKAEEDGVKRLYFLARDGYSMYRMASILCEKINSPIECRYLHCSRYAWRSAEFHLMGEKCLDYVCLGGIDVTLRKMMYRAGLDDEEAVEAVRAIKETMGEKSNLGESAFGNAFNVTALDTPLSYRQVKDLQPALAACAPFMNKIYEKAAAAYPNACGFLEQEGFLDGTTWALVDSGWIGSMQKTLLRLLQSMGYQGGSKGYYFGMYEMPDGTSDSTYTTWYFGPHDQIRRKVYFSNSLFECIYSATEGMTKGYAKQGEKYVPVFENPQSPNAAKISKSTEYLENYAKTVIGKNTIANLPEMSYNGKVVYALLRLFMGKPLKEEVEEYGNYVFSDDVIGEETQVVAAKLTEGEIKENYFFHKAFSFLSKKGKPVKESAWLEGSMVRGRKEGHAGLWHNAFYKYVLYIRKSLGR